jgi:hypothetical protein
MDGTLMGRDIRLQAKVRLIEAIRDSLRKEAEHLVEVGWYTRAQHFSDAADALDALNKDDAQ